METKEFFGASVAEALKKARQAGYAADSQNQYRVVDNLAFRPMNSSLVAVILKHPQLANKDEDNKEQAGFGQGEFDKDEAEAWRRGQSDWAVAYCRGIMKRMGLAARIHTSKQNTQVLLHIECEQSELDLKRGTWREFRGALQHLVNRSASRGKEKEQIYILDLCGTLTERMRKMEHLAGYLVDKVAVLGKSMNIRLMDSQDRRLLHVYLGKYDTVKTTATGSKRYRILTTSPVRKP